MMPQGAGGGGMPGGGGGDMSGLLQLQQALAANPKLGEIMSQQPGGGQGGGPQQQRPPMGGGQPGMGGGMSAMQQPQMGGGKGSMNPLMMLFGGGRGMRAQQAQGWQQSMQEREAMRAQEMDTYNRNQRTSANADELRGRQVLGRTLLGMGGEGGQGGGQTPGMLSPVQMSQQGGMGGGEKPGQLKPDESGYDLQRVMQQVKKNNPDIAKHPEDVGMVLEAFKPFFKQDSQESIAAARLTGQQEGRDETARHHEVTEEQGGGRLAARRTEAL